MAQAPPGGLATTIDPELYRSVLGRYATGVTVVTTFSDCFAGAPSTLPRSAFCDAPYRLGGTGMPLLDDALATIEASVERVVEAGDHTIYLARVLELRARDDDAWPLLYFRGRYLRIEHAATEELRGRPDA